MHPSLPQQAYDELADLYAAMADTKPHNAYYERPALRSLIGGVQGQTILDAGCGTGVNCEWLLQQGARVVGVDANRNMLAHARKRVGDTAPLLLANLEEPLGCFENRVFDGIVSALAVTYVRDHQALFGEFARLLKPGGWLVFSTEHPFFSYRYFQIDDYFQTREVSCEWTGFGKPVRMPSYYHSLGSITAALAANGFVIEQIKEPLPTRAFAEADPLGYQKLMSFPLFICFRARMLIESPEEINS